MAENLVNIENRNQRPVVLPRCSIRPQFTVYSLNGWVERCERFCGTNLKKRKFITTGGLKSRYAGEGAELAVQIKLTFKCLCNCFRRKWSSSLFISFRKSCKLWAVSWSAKVPTDRAEPRRLHHRRRRCHFVAHGKLNSRNGGRSARSMDGEDQMENYGLMLKLLFNANFALFSVFHRHRIRSMGWEGMLSFARSVRRGMRHSKSDRIIGYFEYNNFGSRTWFTVMDKSVNTFI